MGNVVHWAMHPSAISEVSTSKLYPESNHFSPFHSHHDGPSHHHLFLGAEKVTCFHSPTTKTHSPYTSLKDMWKAWTRPWPTSGFLLHLEWNQNSLAQPMRPFVTWLLHTSPHLPLAHHAPGTLAFLLFLEFVKFFSTSESLLVLGTITMGCIYWALTMHQVLSKPFTCMNSFHPYSNTMVCTDFPH